MSVDPRCRHGREVRERQTKQSYLANSSRLLTSSTTVPALPAIALASDKPDSKEIGPTESNPASMSPTLKRIVGPYAPSRSIGPK